MIADKLDVKKQEEVLQESYMMVPDSKGRLEKTIVTLADIMVFIDHMVEYFNCKLLYCLTE